MLLDSKLYTIRQYEEGDENEFVRLFNEAYGEYAGFVPRTPEYWRWCCFDRPDVDRKGILVVEKSGKIVAYTVVGKSGNIWELCADDDNNRRGIVSLILKSAVEYLMKTGAYSVTLNVPSEDVEVRKTCKELGFREDRPIAMFVSILDLKGLIELLINSNKKTFANFNEDVMIVLENAPIWAERNIIIRTRKGQVQVTADEGESDIVVETDIWTLSSTLFGTFTPIRVLMNRKLRIRPFWKIFTLMRFFLRLRMRAPWFFPMSDLG